MDGPASEGPRCFPDLDRPEILSLGVHRSQADDRAPACRQHTRHGQMEQAGAVEGEHGDMQRGRDAHGRDADDDIVPGQLHPLWTEGQAIQGVGVCALAQNFR